MGTPLVRYELLVETRVAPAALCAFRVPLTRTTVPRRTMYRFRVPADRDLPDVLDRLTRNHVEVLEIRRCPGPPSPRRDEGAADQAARTGTATATVADTGTEAVDAGTEPDGVVVPFAPPLRPGRPTGRRAGGDDASAG
jgi:hypothetical protein